MNGLVAAMQFATFAVPFVALIGPVALLGDDAGATKAKPAFELLDGDRVVFLGNTLIERMARYGYVEAALTARWPDRNITFRNLGWSGDTVWAESRGLFDPPAKGYERMLKHVGELKPTVIFLGYGNVEAFDAKWFGPVPMKPIPFRKQYEALLDDLMRVSAKHVRFVVLSPTPMEKNAPAGVDVEGYNECVKVYSGEIHDICTRRGVRYVALGGRTFFCEVDKSLCLTHDGLQLTERGYATLAHDLCFDLGLAESVAAGNSLKVQFSDGKVALKRFCQVENTRFRDDSIRFDLTPHHLCWEWYFQHDSVNDVPLELKFGGTTFPAESSLASPGNRIFGFVDHPDARQLEDLRKAIVEKNRLYFLKWRPQNVTYLTLFRKHEQGQNAKELAEFDKLVAEKEAEIAKLRKPVKRTYELIRVEEK